MKMWAYLYIENNTTKRYAIVSAWWYVFLQAKVTFESFRISQFLQQLIVSFLLGKTRKIQALLHGHLQAPVYSMMINWQDIVPN